MRKGSDPLPPPLKVGGGKRQGMGNAVVPALGVQNPKLGMKKDPKGPYGLHRIRVDLQYGARNIDSRAEVLIQGPSGSFPEGRSLGF